MSFKPNHRQPTKHTPFSNNAPSSSVSHSHHQRMTMTTSIRKAKRGQAVARKRHIMQIAVATTATTSTNNPYSRDGQHVQEAVQLARSIVQLCSPHHDNTDEEAIVLQQLATALDQLCVLLTPDDTDVNPSSQQLNLMHGGRNSHDYTLNDDEGYGESYDSSMAGMAANAILSQFIHTTSNNNGGERNLAVALANSLGHILSNTRQQQHPYATTNNDNERNTLQIKAVVVLNQLAATDPPPPQQLQHQQPQLLSLDSSSMGGGASVGNNDIPTSWCHVIVNSTVLSSLLSQMILSDVVNNNDDSLANMILCEKCISVMGNLLGDSFLARQALLELGVVSKLMACVGLGLEKIKLLLLGQQQQQQLQPQCDEMLGTILQLIRNSVWSLINVVRGGDTSPSSMTEIQSIDLAMLLSLPESIQSIVNTVECTSASFDAAIETCWLIVFLTNQSNYNEAQMFGMENWLTQEVLLGLVTRLLSGASAAAIRFHQKVGSAPLGNNESTLFLANHPQIAHLLSNSSIPCCRALTNISIYVESISPSVEGSSQAKQIVTSALLTERTTKCLGELISIGTIGGGSEASAIACSASSLASICLTDASRDFEKYSPSEVWPLLPSLVQGLIAPLSNFDFRREVVWALWNMLQYNPIQDRLLMGMISATQQEEVAKALTNLLTTLESSDAVEPALGLIDMLLRRLDGNHTRAATGKSLKIVFEEVGLVDALWYVCDNDVDESEVAEMAAELLDDFYEEQEEEDDEGHVAAPSVDEQQFQFQAPSNTGQFNFS